MPQQPHFETLRLHTAQKVDSTTGVLEQRMAVERQSTACVIEHTNAINAGFEQALAQAGMPI